VAIANKNIKAVNTGDIRRLEIDSLLIFKTLNEINLFVDSKNPTPGDIAF